jgi:hypothetical protein
MRLAYMTTDEVNRARVARMVAECGAAACTPRPGRPPRDGECDAVLYSLDDLTGDERSALIEELCGGGPDRPTAVHGYGLTDEQARALDHRGVAVARRLHPGLICGLLTAARRGRETAPPDDAGIDLTWVNLVG